jgi:hypothetical protein
MKLNCRAHAKIFRHCEVSQVFSALSELFSPDSQQKAVLRFSPPREPSEKPFSTLAKKKSLS